jgi:hypothetical protein
MKCRCGSYGINPHLHGRDGSRNDLCDVCYWRNKANTAIEENQKIRDISPKILEVIESGSCSSDCSIEFFQAIPNEVNAVIRRLKTNEQTIRI